MRAEGNATTQHGPGPFAVLTLSIYLKELVRVQCITNCHSCQWDNQIWICRVATSGKSEQSHQIGFPGGL